MTPAHGNDSPGDGSQEHGATDSPTVPIPLPRRRRTPRLRILRRAAPLPTRPAEHRLAMRSGRPLRGTGLLATGC